MKTTPRMTLSNIMKKLQFLAVALTMTLAPLAYAEEGEPAPVADDLQVNQADSLEELLKNVEERRVVESRTNTEREQRFSRDKAAQAQLLRDAQAERTREERRSEGAGNRATQQ